MHAFTSTATHKLEALAQRIGVACRIRVIEAQEDGRYFVTHVDEEPLKQPVALGFTDEQASYALKSRTWERYALRGAPTRLGTSGAHQNGSPSQRHYSSL